ncbi:MAG TPA: class I SAM-dependent methyltransferase [Phycisphaerae bacterium]|nr:class I SAM-dependent methyltransferase [Phycisphaerae bacterium]HDZ44904.1 class I SAM-dependent methyltransferase [Phycisphaerae bacterium]
MNQLLDIVNRKLPPTPWEEGDCIPWSDPAFSERMLKEHLRQDHDAASRRTEKIDEQVAWIHGDLLAGQPTKVLELTCGPGLYTSRLARLGHECVGIDYAPAAIRYAQDNARKDGLACTYRLDDVRQAAYGQGFGLVMMIFGQFNVFRRSDARAILAKAHAALASGGRRCSSRRRSPRSRQRAGRAQLGTRMNPGCSPIGPTCGSRRTSGMPRHRRAPNGS